MGSSGTERSSKSQVRRGSSWKSACLRSAFFLVLSSLWCSIHGAAYPSFPAAKPELTHGAFTPISPSKGSLEGETPLGTLKELVEEHTHSESELHLLSPNNDDSLGRADSNLPSPMEGQDSVPAGISSSTTPGNTDTYAGVDPSQSLYGDNRSSHSFLYNRTDVRTVNELPTLQYVGMVSDSSGSRSTLEERIFEVQNLPNDSTDASNEQQHRFKRTAEPVAIRKKRFAFLDSVLPDVFGSLLPGVIDSITGSITGSRPGSGSVNFQEIKEIIKQNHRVVAEKVHMNFLGIENNFQSINRNYRAISAVGSQVNRNLGAINRVGDQVQTNFGAINRVGDQVQTNFGAINRVGDQVQTNFGAINRVGDQVDKTFEVINRVGDQVDRNLKVINLVGSKVDLNFIAINHVGDRVDRNLMGIIEGFSIVGTRFDTVEKFIKDGINQVVGFIKETNVQRLISELLTSLEYFATEEDSLPYLGEKELVSKFENGFLKNLEEARTPQSSSSLHVLLHNLINQRFAIPEDKNDKTAFLALDFLCAGTKAYVGVMGLLRHSYNFLAHHYYKRNDIDKFNKYFSQSSAVLTNLKSSLTGSRGLMLKVIDVLEEVKRLPFVDDYRSGKTEFLLGQIELFSTIKSNITSLETPLGAPENRVNIYISDSNLTTPIGKWERRKKVRYAMQQFSSANGYTPVGEWSHAFTIIDKAAPFLNIGSARNGISRIIFRNFDGDHPELVGIIEDGSQTVFRDISRELYNAASELNEQVALDEIPTLLENGADIHARFDEGLQAIHAAARSGNFAVIQMLLKHDASINAVDVRGYTPLHVAVEAGHATLTKEIIKNTRASVNAKALSGRTPLHVAAAKGFLSCITALLENSDDIDVNAKASGGFTALHFAASEGFTDSVNLLLNDPRTDVNAMSETGLTPLHLASLADRGSTVSLLLGNKMCRKVKAEGGLLPLHLAATAGHRKIVAMLMKHDIDHINIKSVDGFTPLHLAISRKHEATVLELLSSDRTEINLQGKGGLTALHLAAVSELKLKIVKLLVERGADLNIRDTNGYTALDLVSRSNPSSPIKKYLAETMLEKANASGRLIDRVPLHWAISNDHLGVVQYLVEEKEANVNEREIGLGNAPLHLAARRNSSDLFSYLLEKEADRNLKRADGKTPYDLVTSLNDSAAGSVEKKPMLNWYEGVITNSAASLVGKEPMPNYFAQMLTKNKN